MLFSSLYFIINVGSEVGRREGVKDLKIMNIWFELKLTLQSHSRGTLFRSCLSGINGVSSGALRIISMKSLTVSPCIGALK